MKAFEAGFTMVIPNPERWVEMIHPISTTRSPFCFDIGTPGSLGGISIKPRA